MIKPRWFLLENVRMEAWCLDQVNRLMGVNGVMLCSSLVSAQTRKRYFWTNIPIKSIKDREINIKDILQTDESDIEPYRTNPTASRIKMWANGQGTGNQGTCINLAKRSKSNTLTTMQDRWNNAGLIPYKDFCRYLTHVECERLQTIPDNWTQGMPSRARYAALGNAWTVDLVAEIFKGMA